MHFSKFFTYAFSSLVLLILMQACSTESGAQTFAADFVSDPMETGSSPGTNEGGNFLEVVNHLRVSGTYCGDLWYPPVGPVKWNLKLEKAASGHAADMVRREFFLTTISTGVLSPFGSTPPDLNI